MTTLEQILKENNYQVNLNDKTRLLVREWLQYKREFYALFPNSFRSRHMLFTELLEELEK